MEFNTTQLQPSLEVPQKQCCDIPKTYQGQLNGHGMQQTILVSAMLAPVMQACLINFLYIAPDGGLRCRFSIPEPSEPTHRTICQYIPA